MQTGKQHDDADERNDRVDIQEGSEHRAEVEHALFLRTLRTHRQDDRA